MINRYYPVTKYPTDIPGLLYRPSIEPEYSDCADHIEPFHSIVTDKTTLDQYYSTRNRLLLADELGWLCLHKEGATGLILEIGIAIVTSDRPFKNTSTCVLTTEKADSVMYYGIDISEDKAVESDSAHGVRYLLGCDSCIGLFKYSRPLQFDALEQCGIDLLHVDGNHSVTGALNDWRYTQFLKPNGVAIFHDTNVHPGPTTVLDAVDPNLFSVRQYFRGVLGDFGMAVIRRRRINP